MGTQHQISIIIPADVLQQSSEHLQSAAKLLQPYLYALTGADRQVLAKMGDKTIPFVAKNLDYSKSNGCLPSVIKGCVSFYTRE